MHPDFKCTVSESEQIHNINTCEHSSLPSHSNYKSLQHHERRISLAYRILGIHIHLPPSLSHMHTPSRLACTVVDGKSAAGVHLWSLSSVFYPHLSKHLPPSLTGYLSVVFSVSVLFAEPLESVSLLPYSDLEIMSHDLVLFDTGFRIQGLSTRCPGSLPPSCPVVSVS